MYGGPEDDGSSLLHALKDRPRTTYEHTSAHMLAGPHVAAIEDAGKCRDATFHFGYNVHGIYNCIYLIDNYEHDQTNVRV